MAPLHMSLLAGILIGAICSILAKKKGRGRINWFLIGFFFGIFGIMALFFMPPREKTLESPEVFTLPPLFDPESPLTQKVWYYLTPDRTQKGPMSYKALEEAFHNNKISQDTYLWHDELEEWKPLSLIQE